MFKSFEEVDALVEFEEQGQHENAMKVLVIFPTYMQLSILAGQDVSTTRLHFYLHCTVDLILTAHWHYRYFAETLATSAISAAENIALNFVREASTLAFNNIDCMLKAKPVLHKPLPMGWGNIYRRRMSIFSMAILIYLDYKQREKWMDKSKISALWQRAHERNAKRVLNLIIKLEGLWVKFGEYLSTRADVLPAAYISLLKQLQDSLPPRPVQEKNEPYSSNMEVGACDPHVGIIGGGMVVLACALRLDKRDMVLDLEDEVMFVSFLFLVDCGLFIACVCCLHFGFVLWQCSAVTFEGAFVKGVDSVSWMANNSAKLLSFHSDGSHYWTFFGIAASGKGDKVPQVLSIVLCHIGGIWLGKTNGITLQTKYIREAQEQMATIVSVFAFGE
ncbi:hypothetical protein KPL70_023774 [Citrus sinensis]|nr:hypothetical protein KPL70_023774 [Citrus sinensis]